MELHLTAQSSFPSPFSFPLCYSTPDTGSDSDTSAHCRDQLQTLPTVWSAANCSGSDTGACANSGGGERSHTAIFRCTPSLLPPSVFTKSARKQGLKDDCVGFALTTLVRTAKKDPMEMTDGCSSGKTQGISYSAPPALMFAASRGTSVASSFSSESIPVVTTSQGSTELESSSYTASGPADGDIQTYEKMLEEEQAARCASFCPKVCSTDQSPTENALDPVVTSKHDVAEGNLMNNPELALSLESVLTVVPQSLRQSSAAVEAKEPESKEFIKEQFLKKPSCDASALKPRCSTSSCGDVSFQSWDSHLEIDAAIEDIVESVIHELSICETDFHSCSDTFSREDCTVDVPRRASPASLSSYTSSKRLEWDNGADIGYSGASERAHGHERLQYPDIESHICRSNTSVFVNEAGVSREEKTCIFAGPHFRDVIVQTEACSIKDAEVQASASATNLAITETDVTALMEQPDLLISNSGAKALNVLAPTRLEHSLASPAEDDHQQNYNEREAHFMNCKAVDHMRAKEKPASSGSFEMPMQDYASSVSLCYSHRIVKEPGNSKKHASSVRKYTADNIGQVEKRHDFITASDASNADAGSLDVTGFTIINNNRLKMRFPAAVPGLASRSATPAELPRACSELNKRRLDYWLSSGFPYVSPVVPLETGALPRIRTADPVTAKQDCRDPRLVVSGSNLPSLTQCQEVTNVTRTDPAGMAASVGGMIRKRYIARPAPLKASKTSRANAVLSMQASALCQKLVRRDKLSVGQPTKPSLVMMSDAHSGIPSLSGAAKSTLLLQGHSEDALLSRSDESEAWSSREPLAAPRKQVCGRHSSTSYSTASEGTSSQLLSVNGKSCKLKRLAHKELEKLRFLVDRQRHGYLKQLQREVERLHRLEQLFLLTDGRRTGSSPETRSASTENNSEDLRRSTDKNSVAVQTSHLFPANYHSEDDVAKDRCFVSVGGGSGVKKQRDRLSPRKRKPTSKRPVAWVVPLGSNSQHPGSKHRGSSPKGKSQQLSSKEESLQAAFAAHCSRLIKRSEARQSQVASLAERRRTQRSVLPQTQSQQQDQVHPHPPGNRGGAPAKKTFTHKEMREQTERVYRKLPEVVDSKTKLHREQQYRTNRLMAQLYKKTIQEKALLGCVNFPLNKPFTQL